MATLTIYNRKREKVGEVEVSDSVFGVEPKTGLLHEVVRWQLACRRAGTASTKTRSEVRGGGRKPWRQKGTGRARAGSSRSPVWRHGGTTFGPKPRDYSYALPKKVRRLGLKMALSTKVSGDAFFVIDDFGIDEIKTKKIKAILDNFKMGKTLIILDSEDQKIMLSARNIPGVKVLLKAGLNVYDLLNYDSVLLTEPTVTAIEERLKA